MMARMMKNKSFKAVALLIVSVITCLLITGCASEDHYETLNSEGYTVSVKFDANGGVFTTNTTVIVDSFDPSSGPEISLISPDDDARGDGNTFTATNNGYFLAGWYKERIEESDGSFSYAGRWNFKSDKVTIDPNATYSADEPVMTLYAAWIPMFNVDFYNLDDSKLVGSFKFDPKDVSEISVPCINEEKGEVELFDFPERDGFTFENAYYDEAATQKIETDTFLHPGVVDYENATATDTTMNVYVEWKEGDWYYIYNADQFIDLASVKGSYDIKADLDFTDKNWPTSFVHGKFAGCINGNGHTLKNIEILQRDASKDQAGLFGSVEADAYINNVKFDNVTFTMQAGTRKSGSCFGLFAGRIVSGATLDGVSITSSKLQIDSDSYFGTDDYSIGLVCGSGENTGITTAEITYEAVGEYPETVTAIVNGYTAVNEQEN
ncbi:MAG: hypothetical protein IJA55_01950 [Clostridia bacterium]|nr:hypothetical protein [Clostridia bacterium]